MQAELIILGCGDSAGTPRIGNNWGKCDPSEPKNIRTRASICIRSKATTLIVDTGPDFKHQFNREKLDHLDAVIYTHAHGDHVNGMDDLRPWHDRYKQRIPVYLQKETLDDLNFRFNYIFRQKTPLYPPIVDTHIWEGEDFGQQKKIGDITFIPFQQDHGYMKTLGLRFGNVAYSTDVINFDEKALDILKGVDTWIVDGANLYIKNPVVHMSLERIQKFNENIGARQIYLTHMKNDLDYKTLIETLPQGIAPAYDGLKIQVAL